MPSSAGYRMQDECPPTGNVRISARASCGRVTISRSTTPNGLTSIGCDCLLMANSHVGHDSTVRNFVTWPTT